MNKLISFFGNSALDSFKKFSSSVNEAINSFEWSDIDNAFDKAHKSLNESMQKLKARVKTTDKNVVINIPYDRNADEAGNCETLHTSINNGFFTAKVVKKNEGGDEITSNETSVYLDSDVDLDSMTQRYDSESKKMYFTFKKKTE